MYIKKKDLYITYFVLFIDSFGWAVVFPLFSPLILDAKYHFFNANLSEHSRELLLAFILLAYPLTQLIGSPFFGDFADRWGRKKAFIFTLTGVLIGFFFSAIFLLSEFYIGLLFSRLFTGFFAGNATISYAVIADFSRNKRERIEHFALGSVFMGLGWIAAMFVGTEVFHPIFFRHLNPSLPFWIMTIFVGITLLIVVFLFYESHPVKEKSIFSVKRMFIEMKTILHQPRFRILVNAYCLRSIVWTVISSWIVTISIQKYDFSEKNLRDFLVINGLVSLIINLLTAFVLVKKFSMFKMVLLGFLCGGISLFLAISTNTLGYVIFYLIAVVFLRLTWNIKSLISLSTNSEEQGLVMGALQSIYALGMILGPLLAAGLSFISLSFPFYFSGALSILGFFILFFWKNRNSAASHK